MRSARLRERQLLLSFVIYLAVGAAPQRKRGVLRPFCSVLRRNFAKRKTRFVTVLCFASVLRCFARCSADVYCERYFVQYSRDFWLLENARNTRAYSYCEFCVCFYSSVFRCFSRVFCVFCGNTAKHSQSTRKAPAKHHKTPAKHHKTPQNTFSNKTQPKFANKPILARNSSLPPPPVIVILQNLLYHSTKSYIYITNSYRYYVKLLSGSRNAGDRYVRIYIYIYYRQFLYN